MSQVTFFLSGLSLASSLSLHPILGTSKKRNKTKNHNNEEEPDIICKIGWQPQRWEVLYLLEKHIFTHIFTHKSHSWYDRCEKNVIEVTEGLSRTILGLSRTKYLSCLQHGPEQGSSQIFAGENFQHEILKFSGWNPLTAIPPPWIAHSHQVDNTLSHSITRQSPVSSPVACPESCNRSSRHLTSNAVDGCSRIKM